MDNTILILSNQLAIMKALKTLDTSGNSSISLNKCIQVTEAQIRVELKQHVNN